ncbi:transcription elongation factor GreA [Candidatus Uhrbacteria bacterium]|nr:transcription elongation factor GreA [Candidatus Uhrbacteria bacterium]
MSNDQFMSQQKFQALQEELQRRKTEGRKEIAHQLEVAKQQGDLSENFEYHDAKERQGENEMRVLQLEAMLSDAKIVEEQHGGNTVEMGVTFTAEKNGEDMTFQIVGSHDANPMERKISNESPLGQAFLGAKVGQTVKVNTPSGEVSYTVKSIH